jgi:hypothetical protein
MPIQQQRITDLPLTKEGARQLAEDTLIAEVGTTPSLGSVKEFEDRFVFDVDVSYPRVIWDEAADEPRKTRFLYVGRVGEITVDRFRGRVLDRPKYYSVQSAIREKLAIVSDTVEKGLVKVAADEFAGLPFPIHLHTPVLDMLSWLLVHDRMNVEDLAEIPHDPQARIMSTLEPLKRVGLIETRESTILPGPFLVEIEQRESTLPRQLSKALALFFREGYQFLDTVRQVLGAHLTVSGLVYERATEFESPVPLSLSQIERDFTRVYPSERLVKLPRYLVQLEAIGVLDHDTKGGVQVWSASEPVYTRMSGDEVLDPLRGFFTTPSPFPL